MWDAISGDEKTSDWESEIYKELGRGFDYSITNSTGKRVTVLYRFRSLVEFINKVPGMIFMPQGMLENENLVMGNKMINEVTLRNFKCYKNQLFELANLTVFCGNNSSGKSTVIQSLLLILQNNFSNKLELRGDYVQPGSYNDLHNRNADEDSLSILIDTSVGAVSWGYSEDEFSSQKERKSKRLHYLY